jgi:hypothetical protein
MTGPSPFSTAPDAQANAAAADPRLKPTPDWGPLGPGADIFPAGAPRPRAASGQKTSVGLAIAVIVFAVGTAVLFRASHAAYPPGGALADLFTPPRLTSARDTRTLNRMKPQQQAEALLELAVAHSEGAVEEIEARRGQWHRQLRWSSRMSALTGAALNSPDRSVREAGVEVEIVAYGMGENQASLDYLLKYAESTNQEYKTWALWALGLMGNRGVGTDQVLRVLTAHLSDSDEESRRWAVEGLALTGADPALDLLLRTLHDDAALNVRGRAAAGIGEAGLFTSAQRYRAIPQLLNDTDDASLDAKTQGYAFHALRDISHQPLPNNTAAWRGWYAAKTQQERDAGH